MMTTHTRSAAGHPLRTALRLRGRRSKLRKATRARDDDDFKLFVLSYTAFFVCFYSFVM